MSPRLPFCSASRSLAMRMRPLMGSRTPVQFCIASRRSFVDETGPKPATSRNPEGLGNVSEEAADIGRAIGETRPNLEQRAPVKENLERDEEGKENSPEVIKEDMKNEGVVESAPLPTLENLLALAEMEAIAAGRSIGDVEDPGHKFGLPTLPIPSTNNMKYRYDPVVKQLTNLMMRHGKLGVAQRNMSFILNHLRTAPAPVTNPNQPLLPGAPPAHHLPLDPVLYVTLAIDSVAPLLRIRSQKGAMGGGQALHIPAPLGLRQRRRTAIQWILDAADKRQSRGSGRGQFALRVAEEIVSVMEGRSTVWEKRATLHKSGTSNRSNVMYFQQKRRAF